VVHRSSHFAAYDHYSLYWLCIAMGFLTIWPQMIQTKNCIHFLSLSPSRHFHNKNINAAQRIGPHNINALSILVAGLLGDCWGEKRIGSTRFHIHMGSRNVEYLHWLHQSLVRLGYCSDKNVSQTKQIGKGGKIYYSYRFRTWSFMSLNWLYDLFYYRDSKRLSIKRIPVNIREYLTPAALAIWLMDDGGISGSGVKISTDGFTRGDVLCLQAALLSNFNLSTTIQAHKKNWVLYFPNRELPLLTQIAKPHMIPSMYYKLNESARGNAI
jgi:ubiquinol-cytochrome c reductase cytochrome b subunit